MRNNTATYLAVCEQNSNMARHLSARAPRVDVCAPGAKLDKPLKTMGRAPKLTDNEKATAAAMLIVATVFADAFKR